jgi:hypothetical protein
VVVTVTVDTGTFWRRHDLRTTQDTAAIFLNILIIQADHGQRVARRDDSGEHIRFRTYCLDNDVFSLLFIDVLIHVNQLPTPSLILVIVYLFIRGPRLLSQVLISSFLCQFCLSLLHELSILLARFLDFVSVRLFEALLPVPHLLELPIEVSISVACARTKCCFSAISDPSQYWPGVCDVSLIGSGGRLSLRDMVGGRVLYFDAEWRGLQSLED